MTHLEIGAHLSHYRIERQLGAGGMGEVYLARDLKLERRVAIKILTADDNDDTRSRLVREARAVAALDHEGIAAVYDVVDDPTGGFIVMQFVEGETLAARLARGRLPPQEALSIVRRVAEALAVAHRRGVIHRDLKPQNIMITPAGQPKLLDFGLARRLAPPVAPEAETESASTARQGVTGTPGYMAPEQIRNQAVDARTDLFALGCLVYECLTGRRAFHGASSADVMAQVLHVDPPAVSSVVTDLGPALDGLCARLLQKSAAERYQSADEVLGAIHALEDTARLTSDYSRSSATSWSGVANLWATRTPRERWVAALGAVVLVVALVVWRLPLLRSALPAPPADAARYYDLGVDALRDGTYARARNNFSEAISLFPSYVQAHLGLTQAYIELDDEGSALKTLSTITRLVPDRTRLDTDDRLRVEGVLASVRRAHGEAIAAYDGLARRHPDDSGAWLDLGRAREAAEQRREARTAFERALSLNPQSPAAHVRLGMLLVQDGKKDEALPYFDEALRLYRVGGNVEGEAEALLSKGVALNNTGELTAATEALTEVVTIAGDRYLLQAALAQFELARVAAQRGQPDEAVTATEAVVNRAIEANLNTVAANGLVGLASLFLVTDPARADRELERAITLASNHGAKRAEMRAQLQRAYLRINTEPTEAVAMANIALAFYGEGRYPLQEAVARNILSRAKEALGEYAEASDLAAEALAFADAVDDRALANDSLQNLGSQLAKQGRLPEALAALDRSAAIYRMEDQVPSLAFTLLRRAEALIVLGRGSEAEPLLVEIEQGITSGKDTNASRPRRLSRLRAIRAATEGRVADIESHATASRSTTGTPADSTDLWARVLVEYGRSLRGTSRVPPDTLAAWPAESSSAETRSELSYWVAQTLRLRGAPDLARKVAEVALAEATAQVNVELRWRLQSLTNLTPTGANSASMPPLPDQTDLPQLIALWKGYDPAAYLRRADLAWRIRPVQ